MEGDNIIEQQMEAMVDRVARYAWDTLLSLDWGIDDDPYTPDVVYDMLQTVGG